MKPGDRIIVDGKPYYGFRAEEACDGCYFNWPNTTKCPRDQRDGLACTTSAPGMIINLATEDEYLKMRLQGKT